MRGSYLRLLRTTWMAGVECNGAQGDSKRDPEMDRQREALEFTRIGPAAYDAS